MVVRHHPLLTLVNSRGVPDTVSFDMGTLRDLMETESPDRGAAWRRRQCLWLAYVPFVFLGPALYGARPREWIVTGVGAAIFVLLFLRVVFRENAGLRPLILYAAALGLLLAPSNLGGVIFLVFAAAAAAHIRSPKLAVWLIAAVVIAASIEALITREVMLFSLGALLPSCVGLLSLHLESHSRAVVTLRRANAEIERLSAVTERERIARDLHDVMGHTLTLIAVKAELAERLAEQGNTVAAAIECRDVRHASRSALKEIRDVVHGYRTRLLDEVGHSRALLEAAGIDADFAVASLRVSGDAEATLAFALREGVTNVVRHAGARHCRVRLTQAPGLDVLEIADDGCGMRAPEGNGLRGIRERAAAVGGTITYESGASGTRVCLTIPVREDAEVMR